MSHCQLTGLLSCVCLAVVTHGTARQLYISHIPYTLAKMCVVVAHAFYVANVSSM